MTTVVIPAHNESSVIARTLSAMVDGTQENEIDVIVVCNGCTDETATITRRFAPAVRVVETDVASKTYALNSATGSPALFREFTLMLTSSSRLIRFGPW